MFVQCPTQLAEHPRREANEGRSLARRVPRGPELENAESRAQSLVVDRLASVVAVTPVGDTLVTKDWRPISTSPPRRRGQQVPRPSSSFFIAAASKAPSGPRPRPSPVPRPIASRWMSQRPLGSPKALTRRRPAFPPPLKTAGVPARAASSHSAARRSISATTCGTASRSATSARATMRLAARRAAGTSLRNLAAASSGCHEGSRRVSDQRREYRR